jgi:hypothetical protein
VQPDLERAQGLAQLLRALPQETAAPYDFREFQHRAQRRTRAARSQTLAAGALLALGLIALSVRFLGPAPPAPAPPWTENAPAVTALAPLARSALMEHWLASLPQEPAVVHLGTRAAVTGLEDRIAQLDDLLSAARAAGDARSRLQVLQQERVRLVGTLVQVRYAETLADDSL